jgi:hypothetical protein
MTALKEMPKATKCSDHRTFKLMAHTAKINADKKVTVMTISRQPSLPHIMIDEKKLEIVEYFNCLGSMVTNNARCASTIQYRIAKAAFKRKKTFHQQTGFKFKEETSEMPHLERSFEWC